MKDLIKKYLQQQKLMQLATIDKGNPWACSIWYGFDEELNLYCFDSIHRRHNMEIEKNQKVAGAIVLPHTPTDKPRGLQFEGEAVRLTDEKDIAQARLTYEGRIFDKKTIDEFLANKDSPHAFHKVTPKKYVLFDVVNFPDDPRQELEL